MIAFVLRGNFFRFAFSILAMGLLAIASPATVSAGQAASPAATAAPPLTSYKLGPGDRLALAVVGQPEFAGELIVDAIGDISVPLIGALRVGGLSISEAQSRVAEALSKGFLKNPAIFLRIVETRPVYVLGDVRLPGAYPFRPSSLVKSAIAQAGGLGVPDKISANSTSDFLQADERLHVLNVSRIRNAAKKTRLEAQLEGSETFTPPAVEALSVPGTDVTRFFADEQKTLELESAAQRDEKTAVAAQKPQLEAEYAALEGQIEQEKKQVDLVANQIADYEKLSEKGLGRTSQMIELKLALAGKQSNVWRLEAERSRLRLGTINLDIKLQEIDSSYRKQILKELQDVRTALADVEATIPTAREIRTARLQVIGGFSAAAPDYRIKITRASGAEVNTLDANDTTRIEPGDVIEVRMLRPSEAGAGVPDRIRTN